MQLEAKQTYYAWIEKKIYIKITKLFTELEWIYFFGRMRERHRHHVDLTKVSG